MSTRTLYDKVWDLHTVQDLPTGQTQLFVGLHLIHEVTSPQAFGMLRERGLRVAYPELTIATADHILPTANLARPFANEMVETMMQTLEVNTAENDITFFDPDSGRQGIVHVVGPEQGLTQPGMVIVCGDSHTSTHGAFGAIGFGIGTSQIRDVLATQCIAMTKQKVRRITVSGVLPQGVYAKDIILKIIGDLGVEGGIGYVYEYAGETIENLNMEGRMTICNMSIEGGARAGYVNPNDMTYDYLKGRPYAPTSESWSTAVDFWKSMRSEPDASYDDVVSFDASTLEPQVTWGITPGQTIGVTEPVPDPTNAPASERPLVEKALRHMDVTPGRPLEGTAIDVAFLGSCTNSRISDLREAAGLLTKLDHPVADSVRALVVPGSQIVKKQAEEEGLDEIFRNAGFEWRDAGCSMCLGMNDDQLQGRELSASSSNRNFIGRQGSKDGRTVLMSPAMVIAAAVTGRITDIRTLF